MTFSLDIFKKIRHLQIEAVRLADDILAGAYYSAFKGRGIEFEEVREYQIGDDVRYIDWNVSARLGHPFVKLFREERELPVILLVDISGSSSFGSVRIKREIMAELGAALAFTAARNHDRVSLILFSEKVEKYLPPLKGLTHVLRVIRELLLFKPTKKKTNIEEALKFLGNLYKRSAICFLISDFISEEDYSQKLAVLAKRLDLILISVNDPLERVFPSLGTVSFQDRETGERLFFDTSNIDWQEEFTNSAKERLNRLKTLAKKTGVGYIELFTDQPWLNPLRKFFKLRRIRH